MKPIHHALVSARLFGGAPEPYVPLHTAFDLSKSALPDMRHRAALHSVDHGGATMARIYPDGLGEAGIDDLCRQHVEDDQGFQVRLDHWLSECDTPTFARIRRRPMPELAGFDEDPAAAAAARWGGERADFEPIVAYYTAPESVSEHPLAPAVSRNAFGIFFSEMLFGAAIRVSNGRGGTRHVPVRDIGECITIAQFGRIPTLPDVFAGMAKKDWMMGARVARSRRRRCAAAGRDDLFDTESTGIFEPEIADSAALGATLRD